VSHFPYSVSCLNKDKCLPPLRPHPNVSVLLLVELIYLQLNVGWWLLLCNAKLPLVYSAFSAGLHIVLSYETNIFTFIYLLWFVCVYDRSVSSSVNFIIGWS
jgi:hypothetical protein